jgi:hypothetical protein
MKHKEINPLANDVILEAFNNPAEIPLLPQSQGLATFDMSVADIDDFALSQDQFRARLHAAIQAVHMNGIMFVRIEQNNQTKILKKLRHLVSRMLR